MIELSKQQVDFILKDIQSNGIKTSDLQLNLLNHICCLLEREMSDLSQFNECYPKILPGSSKGIGRNTGGNRFVTNVQKLLCHEKSHDQQWNCRSGFVHYRRLTFKSLHLAGAGITLVLGMFVLSFVFFTLAFYNQIQKKKSQTEQNNPCFLQRFWDIDQSLSCLQTHALAQGANMMWLVALGILFFLFLPMYFLVEFEIQKQKRTRLFLQFWFW